jgi:hypothetical protein
VEQVDVSYVPPFIQPGSSPWNPFYLPRSQPWAIVNERLAHDQAMFGLGEYSIWALLWKTDDAEVADQSNDLVTRCPTCWWSDPSVAAAYEQTSDPRCPTCYGTTYAGPHGGLKAMVVRPTMWAGGTDQMANTARGVLITNTAQVQATSDFRAQFGDFIFRADGTRWQIKVPDQDSTETGFEVSTDPRTMVAINYSNVVREDEASVAYLIPPPPAQCMALLDVGPGYPTNFSAIEFADTALIPNQ